MHDGRDATWIGKDSNSQQYVGDGRVGAFWDRKPAKETLPVGIER